MKNYLQKRNNEEFGLEGLNLFDDFFEDFFKPTRFFRNDEMRTDIKETDKGYELSIDMPGFDKKDIKLSLNEGYIKVEANKQEKEEDKKNYIRRERAYSCSRSYYVGENITEEDINAKYDNGILTIDVLKKDKKEIPSHNIDIQ